MTQLDIRANRQRKKPASAWRRSGLLGVLLVVAACSKGPAPDESAVATYLGSNIDQRFSLAVDAMEPFVNKETGQGRVSVSGSVTAKTDLYKEMSSDEVVQAVVDLGIPVDQLVYIRTILPEPTLIRKVITKGDTLPITTELLATKDANGWTFMGGENVQQALAEYNGAMERGAHPANANEVGADGKSPYFETLRTVSAEINAADKKARNALLAHLTTKPIIFRFWQKADASRALRNDNPFTLKFSAPEPPTTTKLGNEPEHISLIGNVAFSGSANGAAGEFDPYGNFEPVQKISVDAQQARVGKIGSIRSWYSLRLRFRGTGDRYTPFQGSPAFFDGGKIETSDEDSHMNWRWAE